VWGRPGQQGGRSERGQGGKKSSKPDFKGGHRHVILLQKNGNYKKKDGGGMEVNKKGTGVS